MSNSLLKSFSGKTVALIFIFLLCCGFSFPNPLNLINHKNKDVKSALPQKQYKFIKYNDPPGIGQINLKGIEKKKTVLGQGIVSPDMTRMVFSEVYLYPQSRQTAPEFFILILIL